MGRLRFNLLRKGGKRRDNNNDDALPQVYTTRPRPGAGVGSNNNNNNKRVNNNATTANKNNSDNAKKNTTTGLLFHKNKKKGPGGIEVTTGGTASTSGRGPTHDEVSVMTPVTGIPPDSPTRVRHLPSLLAPPPISRPLGNNEHLYAGTYSPPSTPTRGEMNINIPTRDGSADLSTEDDISVMTPVTGMISPEKTKGRKFYQQRLAPPQILEDDDENNSRELTVYEDEAGSGGGGISPILNDTRNNNNQSSSPFFPRRDLMEDCNAATKQRRDTVKTTIKTATSKLIKSKKSWLTRTEYFQTAVDSSFDMIDVDKSGDVTMEELYAGLLLIHLKMAVYVGAPACRPASKRYVEEIFHLLDNDNSGSLSKEEFATVMKILYSQVFTRIVIQWSLTLMIVPVISQYIIKYIKLLYWIAHEFWKDIDDDLDPFQRLLWKLWALFLCFTPQWMDRMGGSIYVAFGRVPKGVWKSMPFTMLTLAQTSIALPYALNRVEDFFRRVAHSDVGKKDEESRGKMKEC